VACVAAGQVGTVWATRKENQLPTYITPPDRSVAAFKTIEKVGHFS